MLVGRNLAVGEIYCLSVSRATYGGNVNKFDLEVQTIYNILVVRGGGLELSKLTS